jgi:DNA ligase 4
MPFLYSHICDLLQNLEDEVPIVPQTRERPPRIIEAWFRLHRSLLNATDNDASAILSTLLPEHRTDRVYGIQAARLQTIFGRVHNLGRSRLKELKRWDQPGSGIDLADCVEDILRTTVGLLVVLGCDGFVLMLLRLSFG